MIIPFSKVCHDFMAAHGESPDLLPVLQDGEDSAVLTLEAWLRTMLIPKAIEATLQCDLQSLGEYEELTLRPSVNGGYSILELPDDFLRFISLSIGENPVPLTSVAEAAQIRFRLSKGKLPCRGLLDTSRSSVAASRLSLDEPKSSLFLLPDGRLLLDNIAEGSAVTLRYVPKPFLDSSDLLHISEAAYWRLISSN